MTRLCGATTRSGAKCKKRPAPGRRRCRLHGGASPRGKAAGAYVHGRYSIEIPSRLRERFARAEKDPELMMLYREIMLIDAMISERLQEAEDGNSEGSIKRLRVAFRRVQALRQGHSAGSKTAVQLYAGLDRFEEQLSNAGSYYEGLRETERLVDKRKELVLAEAKRMADLGQVYTLEQIGHFIMRVADVIEKNVTDRALYDAISSELDSLHDFEPKRGAIGPPEREG